MLSVHLLRDEREFDVKLIYNYLKEHATQATSPIAAVKQFSTVFTESSFSFDIRSREKADRFVRRSIPSFSTSFGSFAFDYRNKRKPVLVDKCSSLRAPHVPHRYR